MARYWIGDAGNWEDTAHWSDSSGGSGGFSVPTSSDDVFLDAASFSAGGTITVNATCYMHDLDVSGLDQNVILYAFGIEGFCSGSFVGSAFFDIDFRNYTYFKFNASDAQTIYWNGTGLGPVTGTVYFNGSGSWTLTGPMDLAPSMSFQDSFGWQAGTFYTDNYLVRTRKISGNFAAVVCYIGSSEFWVAEFFYSCAAATIDWGTSHVRMEGVSNDMEVSNMNFYQVTIKGATWGGTGARIIGSASYHTLNLLRDTGSTETVRFRFDPGTTQTITNTFNCVGTSSYPTYLEGYTAATWNMVFSGTGVVTCDWLILSDSHVTPATLTWYAGANSTNGSNNDGWIFTDPPPPDNFEGSISGSSVVAGVLTAKGSLAGETNLKGETLSNGNFDSGAFWTPLDARWVISGGVASYDGTAPSFIYQNGPDFQLQLVSFKKYKLAFRILNAQGINFIRFYINGTATNLNISDDYQDGYHEIIFTMPEVTQQDFFIYPASGAFDIDNVTLKEFVSTEVSGVITNIGELRGEFNVKNESISNGMYNGSSNWDLGASWSYVSGRMYFNDTEPSAPALYLTQTAANMAIPVTALTKYRLEFDIDIPSGNAIIEFSSQNRVIVYVASTAYANGHHIVEFTTPANIDLGGFIFRASTVSSNPFYVDNVTLRERVETTIVTGIFTDAPVNDFQGDIYGSSVLAGVLTAEAELVMDITGSSVLDISMESTGELSGDIIGTSTLDAILQGFINFTGAITSSSIVSGIITAIGNLIGAITGNSTLAGTVIDKPETTGERLVTMSTLLTGTAMDHFLNIAYGGGGGTPAPAWNPDYSFVPVENPSNKPMLRFNKGQVLRFVDLFDTFDTYAGRGGYFLKVKDTEDGITVSSIAIESDKTFVYEQLIASVQWDITHGLNKYPSVEIVNGNNDVILGEILYIDENNISVRFDYELTGKVYCN